MSGDLGALAGEAGGGPDLDVGVHARPKKPGGDEAAGTSNSRVRESVQGIKSRTTESWWQQWAIDASRSGAEQRLASGQEATEDAEILSIFRKESVYTW